MIYTIKQGKHHSNLLNPNRLWVGYGVKTIDFSFQFLNNPCYKLGTEDDWDINKLFGVSFGPEHHNNSFRLGWRPASDDQVSLHSYYYNKGKRHDSFLYIIHWNSCIGGSITIDRDGGNIKTNMLIKSTVVNETTFFDFDLASMWSTRLFPYFGGNTPATHDIFMSLKNDIKCEFKI